MRVLVLSNLYPPDVIGGYEIACAQAVDALRGRGHEVRVLAAAPRVPVPDRPDVLRRFRLAEEAYWSPADPWSAPVARRLRDAESRFVSSYNVHILIKEIEEFAADVVYSCNLIGLGGLGLIACLQYLRVPWVWQLGDNVPGLLCRTLDAAYPAIAAEFSRQARGHYVAVSRQLVEQIRGFGVTLGGDVDVVPYWIVGDRPQLRRRPPAGRTLRIMSAGQVARHKGIGTLIDAAARLRARGCHDFAIDIYGAVYSTEFAEAIRALDLGGQVALKGPRSQSEILALYEQYDVFAFPTLEREPFGLVPLEAAARGCVPIVSQSCGIAEWLVHGVHCLKTPRQPEALAAIFQAILAREIDLWPIARRAAAAVWRDFHLEAIIPRLERKLAAAARQPRTGAGTSAEAYRLARLAEQLTRVLIQESSRVA